MILSDREIQAALQRGAAIISPEPNAKAWSSTAVDLTLASELRRWKPLSDESVDAAVCPGNPAYNYTKLAAKHTEIIDISNHYYDLKAKQFILGWTVEKIKLPHRSRLAARVEGKSSLSRLGLGIHVTAPTIHAGFGFDPADPDAAGNSIQLEIWNIGDLTIRLVPGLPICELIFEEVHGTPDKGYQGLFMHQGPQGKS
jgi:dCTP deaminase